MSFLSKIVLILITLLGYSTGTVMVSREEKKLPQLSDLGISVLLLAAALGSSVTLGRRIIIPCWFLLSGLASALLTKGWSRGRRIRQGAAPALVGRGLLRRAWDQSKTLAKEAGNYQGRLLFAFFYFIVVMPLGIGVRLFGDPLMVKSHPRLTCWSKRDSQRPELEAAREQF